jgi:hypothetical protein
MDISGSALICVAANKEEVIKVLKNDIYADNDVWDFSKVCSTNPLQSYIQFRTCFNWYSNSKV